MTGKKEAIAFHLHNTDGMFIDPAAEHSSIASWNYFFGISMYSGDQLINPTLWTEKLWILGVSVRR